MRLCQAHLPHTPRHTPALPWLRLCRVRVPWCPGTAGDGTHVWRGAAHRAHCSHCALARGMGWATLPPPLPLWRDLAARLSYFKEILGRMVKGFRGKSAHFWPQGQSFFSQFFFFFFFNCGKMGFPGGSDGKRICLQCRRSGFNPWVRKISWRRKWLPTPVFLPGEFHLQKSLADYSPWGCKELDTTLVS